MKFSDWIKIKEQAVSAALVAPAPAPAPAPATVKSTSTASTASTTSSGGTKVSDVAKVPQRMFTGERQTSDNCRSCSKDWKNWHISKKRNRK